MEKQQISEVRGHSRLLKISESGIFLALILAVQMVGLPNPVNGTLVNAMLIFVLLRLGVRYALMLGVLSPIGGTISGHLPALLYPVIPVIMLGNLLLLCSYFFMPRRPAVGRYIVPAMIKGIVIWGLGGIIVRMLSLNDKLSVVFSTIAFLQFFTACVGLFLGEKFHAFLSSR